ncbi:MAG: CPBP family intramembrane glutamic endopeptidase [Polyangiales bacterium]
MKPRSATLWLGAALVAGGLGLASARVSSLERSERTLEMPWRSLAELAGARGSTSVSARLAEVQLSAGQRALFELCSRDDLAPARWLGALELLVLQQPRMELMLRVPLDRAHLERARRGESGACLLLGGGTIERSGRYSVDAAWPARPPSPDLQAVPLRARVLCQRTLGTADEMAVIAIALGVGLGLGLGLRLRDGQSEPLPRRMPAMLGAGLGLAALAGATQIPSLGALATLWKGVGLSVLQAGMALSLAHVFWPGRSRAALGLHGPSRTALFCVAALCGAALLFASARLALRFVPATGEAPIQTFVRAPSGMLCFAALGVLLPVGEELFFRGYLYGAALVLGRGTAFALTLLVFVALHAQQSWGNWGGLSSIAAAGLVLTALRAWSGSVLVPALTHLLYNFALSLASFW